MGHFNVSYMDYIRIYLWAISILKDFINRALEWDLHIGHVRTNKAFPNRDKKTISIYGPFQCC